MKKQFDLESLLPQQKIALLEFLQGHNVFVNSPNDVFPASSNRCRCTVAYSAIPPTLASVEKNQEIMIFTDQKKATHIYVAIQVQPFRRKPKKLRLFSHNKKLKASTEVKENHVISKLSLWSDPVSLKTLDCSQCPLFSVRPSRSKTLR